MDDVREFLNNMGRRMYDQRKRLGMTQEQVAEKADVSPQLLSNAENGTRAISSDKLYRISRTLGVSADYLLCGEVGEADRSLLFDKIQKADAEQLKAIDAVCDIILELK